MIGETGCPLYSLESDRRAPAKRTAAHHIPAHRFESNFSGCGRSLRIAVQTPARKNESWSRPWPMQIGGVENFAAEFVWRARFPLMMHSNFARAQGIEDKHWSPRCWWGAMRPSTAHGRCPAVSPCGPIKFVNSSFLAGATVADQRAKPHAQIISQLEQKARSLLLRACR